jgi:ketosteroid isomerase-like protein
MSRAHVVSLLLMATVGASCATVPPRAVSIETEAREFMAGYARDLRAGDRRAIAARYDRRGAYLAGSGAQQLASPDLIQSRYQDATWTAPSRFDWRDLSYEAVGPDAVLVSGKFDWTTAAGQTLPASYTALLVRRDGRLQIRAEHEDVDPSALRAQLCAR